MTTTPDAPWHKGWLQSARAIASPNFGDRPAGTAISLIVVHSISLPPGQFGGGEIAQLFTNTLDWNAHPYFKQIEGIEVSAHFVIDRQGTVTQFVSCDQRAWHAGRSSFRGRNNCNDFSIGIELEGLEGDVFEKKQYQALCALISAISSQYPIENVSGHEHIAPGRKFDPGAQFDWQLLRGHFGALIDTDPYIGLQPGHGNSDIT
jgi:AmpD protein